MGIQEALSDDADFGGLVKSSRAKISKVIQKAFIEVNEEGAEAAAVTGTHGLLSGILFLQHAIYSTGLQMVVPLSVKLNEPPPLEINADHPFAYVIRDTDTIYFQGHFVRPGK